VVLKKVPESRCGSENGTGIRMSQHTCPGLHAGVNEILSSEGSLQHPPQLYTG
jgi:hypothetical protein